MKNKLTGLDSLALLKVKIRGGSGITQVNNLGALEYANAVAADQIGVGRLGDKVVYSGTIKPDKVFPGTMIVGSVARKKEV